MHPGIRPLLALCVAAALGVGCQTGAPTGNPASRATSKPKPPNGLLPPLPPTGDGMLANNGGNMIGLGGGNSAPNNVGPTPARIPSASPSPLIAGAATFVGLQGLVKAPATLLSNNGGGLISDKGLGLIGNHGAGLISDHGAAVVANNGAGFRLAALPDQVPAAGIRVGLVDATGALALGADEQPFLTTTDARGAYAFPNAPTDRALFVLLDLPGDHGQLVAFVAPGQAAVDVDLVSTLTTGYIYDQYVAPQADPAKTLAKLPADVEAATRAKASAALAAGGSVPARLGRQDVTRLVSGLRLADPAFDGQMEAVRKLLVVAGQADLGNGRPALEVPLGTVMGLAFGPDARLYILEHFSGRVWRLAPDGTLVRAIGSGSLDRAVLTGKLAGEAGLEGLVAIAFDPFGRLLAVESGNVQRLTRLDGDERVTELLRPAAGQILGACAGAGEDVWALTRGAAGMQLLAIAPTGAARVLTTFAAADAAKLPFVGAMARDAEGRLLVASGGDAQVIRRLDLSSNAWSEVRVGQGATRLPVLDPHGGLYELDTAARTLATLDAQGQPTVLPGKLADTLVFAALSGVTRGPDGALYFAASGDGLPGVFKLAGGTVTRIAGARAAAAGGATDLALQDPQGLVALPTGGTLVADRGGHRIWRIAADGQATPFAGTGQPGGDLAEGGQALAAALQSPSDLARDAAGNVYVVTPDHGVPNAIRKIAPDGTITTVVGSGASYFWELEAAPDGTLYATTGDRQVLRLPAGSTSAEQLQLLPARADGGSTVYSLALDSNAVPHWTAGQELYTWTRAGGTKLVKQSDQIPQAWNGSLAIDALGRYFMLGVASSVVMRYDAPADSFKAVTGPGTNNLAGSGIADSLKAAGHLRFDPAGDLLISDGGHKQVKRIPKTSLPE